MTWTKIDDRLHSHPKARKAGLEAMGLWTLGLSFCGAYNTDGRIGRGDVEAIGGRRALGLAERLVSAGLWDPTADGWSFHDFLTYNPSAEAVEAERARKAEAGRKGGLAKAAASGTSHSRNLAPASPVLPEAAVLPIPSRSRPDPEIQIPPSPPSGGTPPREGNGLLFDAEPERAGKAKKDRKRPAKSMPEGWKPNEAHRERARELNLEADLPKMAGAFVDHHRAKGSVFADWDAAFGTWIRNEAKFRTERSGGRVVGLQPPAKPGEASWVYPEELVP